MVFFVLIFVAFFCGAFYIVFFYSISKVLSNKEKLYFSKQLHKISSWEWSAKEKIISYDTLLHKIFQALGYGWSFWEILKKYGKYIPQSQQIWELHRLRNRLVHELFELDSKEAEKQRKKYESIIKSYL